MSCNIPKTENKRVVIVGGGFGGLKIARKLVKSNYQVVLVDKNNSVDGRILVLINF